MSDTSTTAERILNTFLHLVAERGLSATTTRTLADAAGVNEVTIFRHFKDKEALIHAVFQHFDLAGQITAYQISIDTSSAQQAANDLLQCMKYMRDILRKHVALLQFGISEYWKFPEVKQESALAPQAAKNALTLALLQAQPVLRPEVDLDATVLSLLGMLLLTVLWNQNGWLSQDDDIWDQKLFACINQLIDWGRKN